MQAPRIQFNIQNLSFSVANILKGISGVSGITLRGPHIRPDLLVTNWTQFIALYGGYLSSSDFPLLCKRALDRGCQLRVSRVGHYTDVTDKTTLDAVIAVRSKAYTITFVGAFVTSNTINLTINGSAIAQVTYASSSDATLQAIADAIKLITTYVQDAFVVVNGGTQFGVDDRVIVVIPKSTTLSITSIVVAAGASQTTGAAAVITNIPAKTTGTGIFEVVPKWKGADYNNLQIAISAASNGDAAYFNMTVSHANESALTETYQNLTIPGSQSIANQTWLNDVMAASQLVTFSYIDLTAIAAPRPYNSTLYFNTGSDGSAVIATDYVGDAAGGTGFYAFDNVDDMLQIAAPELSDNTVHVGGGAYAGNRKDLMYYAHLSNALVTQATLVTARQTTAINSYYTAFFAGGIKITDPVTGLEKNISELGDVLGIMAFNDEQGEWFSPAGVNRGAIPNALGVVNNFGTNAKYSDLNILANRQVNMVVHKDGIIYLNGNYSAVLSNSKLSFLSTVRFLIWLQKALSPTLKRYLQEPADIPTFKAMFREVQPFLNQLITDRALYDYRWMGDQDVSKITDVVINNATDLDNGKYKVKLYLKIIPSMQEISVDLVVTATSVSFENIK